MLNFFDSVLCETIIAENEAYEQVLAMVRLPFGGLPACRFIASNRILYANAFSLGKITERWRLLSTITIMASSRVSSLTSHFSVLKCYTNVVTVVANKI